MSIHAGAILVGNGGNRSRSNVEYVDEEMLVERCKKHDERAYSQFVDLYQARVFGLVRRMVSNQEEAADITQEVFIRAYQNFGKFDLRASVKTWLFKIAHNLCIDHARKNSKISEAMKFVTESPDEETFEIPDFEWQPEQTAYDMSLADALESAIGKMSDKLRMVLLLHDKEDMSYDEVAVALDIPVGTVKSRLFLARAFLQTELSGFINAPNGAGKSL